MVPAVPASSGVVAGGSGSVGGSVVSGGAGASVVGGAGAGSSSAGGAGLGAGGWRRRCGVVGGHDGIGAVVGP